MALDRQDEALAAQVKAARLAPDNQDVHARLKEFRKIVAQRAHAKS